MPEPSHVGGDVFGRWRVIERMPVAEKLISSAWRAPQSALADTTPEVAPIAPATASPETQQLAVMSVSPPQSIDQLTA